MRRMQGLDGAFLSLESPTTHLHIAGVLVLDASGAPPGVTFRRIRDAVAERVHLVVSTRTPEDLYYAAELPGPETNVIYTRRTPEGWPRPPGRLTEGDLPLPVGEDTTVFVCGSSGFSDAATDILRAAGVRDEQIRVERFGPTR